MNQVIVLAPGDALTIHRQREGFSPTEHYEFDDLLTEVAMLKDRLGQATKLLGLAALVLEGKRP